MMDKVTIRSDRKTDYTFTYKGDDVVLEAGTVLSISGGLEDVVLPTTQMKVMGNLIVIKDKV